MGTRSKKSKAFLVWLCFFMSVNILFALAMIVLPYSEEIIENFSDIMAVIRGDIKDTSIFKADIAERFEYLMRHVSGTGYMESYVNTFSDEGDNLLYYAENLAAGKTIGNVEKDTVIVQESATSPDGTGLQTWDKVILPEGYDYYLYYNGSSFMVQNRNRPVNVYSYNSGYYDTWLRSYITDRNSQHPDIRILLMVKKDIVENPYAMSRLYSIKQDFVRARCLCLWIIGVALLGLSLLAVSLVKRNDKREFDRILARISGRVWLEVKLVLSLLVLMCFYGLLKYFDFSLINCALVLFSLWWFYVMLADLVVHRKAFFANNSVTWAVSRYRRFESKKPFQKALLWRVYALIAAEMILVAISCGIVAVEPRSALLAIPFIAAGLYLLWLYLRRFRGTVNELGMIVDRIEAMKNGEYETKVSIPPDSDLYRAWENLSFIQSGIQRAVEEKLKSERMKMELITNVSHDLKTPLTSIISYTDLIAREKDLPDNVKEYAQILLEKSERLKTIIQDLFELSRAASGDIVLDMERIDLVKLLEQTMADMNEQIEASDLVFKIKTPDTPVYIMGDGKRLYRVFQNLISNVLKYSMKSSRVYISVTTQDNRAIVEIKNVSSYEMDFDEDEIVERFVRGDKARSTEGSGLGLAIARSFTHACGGRFEVSIDGDLFKVKLTFSLLGEEQEESA